MYIEHWWNYTDRENQITQGKTCHSATLSTTSPTYTDLGLSPGLCTERLVTNHLRHGITYFGVSYGFSYKKLVKICYSFVK
jgi:hypothetical protein